MAGSRFFPITRKVNILIILSMVIGIGSITFYLASTLFVTIDELSRRDMDRQADSIYAAIESLMLPGEAPLAQGYFQRLNAIDSAQQVTLFRTTGSEAFRDNSTIRHVNELQSQIMFPERVATGSPRQISLDDLAFVNATGGAGVPRDEFEVLEGEQHVVYRILKPLINLPKCVACHGADHTIRGVLEIRTDVTDTVMIQRATVYAASGAFFALVVILGFSMSRFMQTLILRPVRQIALVCEGVTEGDFSNRVSVSQRDEIGSLGERVNKMIEGLVERFKLSKYVSGSTIRSLQNEESGTSEETTLLFTDIRGFTSFTERHSPEVVVRILNKMLDLQTTCIQSCGGDIDKYVGDEVFAVFEGSTGTVRALDAAVKIQRSLAGLGDEINGLGVGIGINYGPVIRGRMGSESRADFTVIGDNVNVAARLCSAAAPGTILLSTEFVRKLKQTMKAEPAARPPAGLTLKGPMSLRVKGKSQALKVFLVEGVGE